jgi:hypothetical protein
MVRKFSKKDIPKIFKLLITFKDNILLETILKFLIELKTQEITSKYILVYMISVYINKPLIKEIVDAVPILSECDTCANICRFINRCLTIIVMYKQYKLPESYLVFKNMLIDELKNLELVAKHVFTLDPNDLPCKQITPVSNTVCKLFNNIYSAINKMQSLHQIQQNLMYEPDLETI